MTKMNKTRNIETSAADLSRYMTEEFVFHGTTRSDISELIPNKPRDAGNDPKNKEHAVYATVNIRGAIIFSLISGFYGTFSVNEDDGETLAVFPERFFDQIAKNIGYVYVLKKDDFAIVEDRQYKSYTPVSPVAVVPVTLVDFYEHGGRLEFRHEKLAK